VRGRRAGRPGRRRGDRHPAGPVPAAWHRRRPVLYRPEASGTTRRSRGAPPPRRYGRAAVPAASRRTALPW